METTGLDEQETLPGWRAYDACWYRGPMASNIWDIGFDHEMYVANPPLGQSEQYPPDLEFPTLLAAMTWVELEVANGHN